MAGVPLGGERGAAWGGDPGLSIALPGSLARVHLPVGWLPTPSRIRRGRIFPVAPGAPRRLPCVREGTLGRLVFLECVYDVEWDLNRKPDAAVGTSVPG